MSTRVEERTIWRFSEGHATEIPDTLIREVSCRLLRNGEEIAHTVFTPEYEREWGTGHLVTQGEISSLEDLDELTFDGESVSARCARRTSRRNGRSASRIAPRVVAHAVERLRHAPLFVATGSAHVALLCDYEGNEIVMIEDLGRHNAVDKVIGWAFLRNIDLQACFLALSGRLPADMVRKATTAGIPLVASISAATATGVDVAHESGCTLIGFVRDGRMNVYSHPRRLLGVADGSS